MLARVPAGDLPATGKDAGLPGQRGSCARSAIASARRPAISAAPSSPG